MADQIADWTSSAGIASLAFGAVAAIIGLTMVLPVLGAIRHLVVTGRAVVLVLLAVSGSAYAMMPMVGQMSEYPSVATASSANKRAVQRILNRTWANIGRYDTVRKAEALGYSFHSKDVGIQHMRKKGASFWGKLLDPTAPQALMWWCAEHEHCTLVGVMYRAPGSSIPRTYGGLIEWHKHGLTADWMTHVWLTHDTRTAWARCVPFAQLEITRRVKELPYNGGFSHVDPCGSEGAKHMM